METLFWIWTRDGSRERESPAMKDPTRGDTPAWKQSAAAPKLYAIVPIKSISPSVVKNQRMAMTPLSPSGVQTSPCILACLLSNKTFP